MESEEVNESRTWRAKKNEEDKLDGHNTWRRNWGGMGYRRINCLLGLKSEWW